MHREAQHHAGRAGQQADRGELDRVGPGDAPLRQAQHAQHRAVVQVARSEVTRRDGHRHRRQQCRQQRHQVEELAGTVQRLAHLGAAGFQRFDAHAAQRQVLDHRFGFLHEAAHAGVAPVRRGHGQPVGHAAGRLHQAGGGEVRLVQHHARCEAHEAGAAIGLDDDQARDLQRRVAQQQIVARLQRQRIQHRRIGPHRAPGRRLGQRLHGAVGAVAQLQAAAQRVAGADGLHRDQPAGAAGGIGRARHAREGGAGGRLQAQVLGQLQQLRRAGPVAGDHRIAAQQLAGIARQAGVQAVGEEAHRGERGHRQQHGHGQQAQFTGAEITPGLAPGQGPGGRSDIGHGAHGNRIA